MKIQRNTEKDFSQHPKVSILTPARWSPLASFISRLLWPNGSRVFTSYPGGALWGGKSFIKRVESWGLW